MNESERTHHFAFFATEHITVIEVYKGSISDRVLTDVIQWDPYKKEWMHIESKLEN